MKLPLFFFNTVPRNSLIQSLQVIYSREKGAVRTRCSETSVKSDFAFQATLVFPGLGTALLYQWICFCELPAVCVHCPIRDLFSQEYFGSSAQPWQGQRAHAGRARTQLGFGAASVTVPTIHPLSLWLCSGIIYLPLIPEIPEILASVMSVAQDVTGVTLCVRTRVSSAFLPLVCSWQFKSLWLLFPLFSQFPPLHPQRGLTGMFRH